MAPSTPLPAEPNMARASLTWTPKSDHALTSARARGLNWHSIAKNHFPHKTANACRKRHERLLDRRSVEDWDVARLERLATQYMEVRKEIWTILADRVGERWQVVEAKCIETGLRTMATKSKNAGRRDPGTAEREMHDSGLGSDMAESTAGPEEPANTQIRPIGSIVVQDYPTPPVVARAIRYGPSIASLLRSPQL